MKKSMFSLFILVLCILFLNITISKAEVINTHIATAYINGVELKFRNEVDEKNYYQENNQIDIYPGYLGDIYTIGQTYMIPLKKTMDLANIIYYVENENIYLQNNDIIILAKKNSKDITIKNKSTTSKATLKDSIKYNDNIYYVPLEIFEYLNFNYTVQKSNDGVSDDLIFINDNDSTLSYKFTKEEKEKYKELIKFINEERATAENKTNVDGFIRDNNLFTKMNKNNYDGNLKITIPKGNYLQNFYYGKILFLKNGTILGTAKRVKEDNYLSYYINKDKTYYGQEIFLDIADEIVIFCPNCKSQSIIITKNPFKNCDCE